MDKSYLLTYSSLIEMSGFAWFDSEEEMKEFIEHYEIEVIEVYKIIVTEDLTDKYIE